METVLMQLTPASAARYYLSYRLEIMTTTVA